MSMMQQLNSEYIDFFEITCTLMRVIAQWLKNIN